MSCWWRVASGEIIHLGTSEGALAPLCEFEPSPLLNISLTTQLLQCAIRCDSIVHISACIPRHGASRQIACDEATTAARRTATRRAARQTVCAHAIDTFIECYGSEVGVAALKWLPFGGLYISGGIAAKNPSWIQSEEFMNGRPSVATRIGGRRTAHSD